MPYPLFPQPRSIPGKGNENGSETGVFHVSANSNSNLAEMVAGKYGRRLWGFLSARLRHREEVPDLAQEVYLRLLRVKQVESIRDPEAYLFTVASHVLHQHALKSSKHQALDIDDLAAESEPVAADDPERYAATSQDMNKLEAALGELPPQFIAALVLHRNHGYTIEEIGERLGVARPTAKKYLAKALAHCRSKLEADHE